MGWAGVTLCLWWSSPTFADIYFDYEAPRESWRLAQYDREADIRRHHRTLEEAHAGASSEFISLWGRGTYAYLTQKIPPGLVIDDLQASLWVKANRRGLQLMVLMVLPESRDRSGRPITALLRGTIYSDPHTWQQLVVANVRKLMDQQIIKLRDKYGPQVTADGAYIDRIVLNALGGDGLTNVWIDDLLVTGHVEINLAKDQSQVIRASHTDYATGHEPPDRSFWDVRQRGTILEVDGRPFFPIMVEYNGESFERLKQFGFNTIKLSKSPSPQQLAEASRLRLRLVAPPPQLADGATVAPRYDPVLAWSLGHHLSPSQYQSERVFATQVRRADQVRQRPLVGHATADAAIFQGITDIQWLDQSPIAASLNMPAYRTWLRKHQNTAVAGTAWWAYIQTQPLYELEQQWIGFSGGAPLPQPPIDWRQMRLMALNAVAAGARGVCFKSRHRLDAQDLAAVNRAHAVRIVTRELQAIAPWAAAGRVVDEFAGDQDSIVSILETERSRLAIAVRATGDEQIGVQPVDNRSWSFGLSHALATDNLFRIRPTSLDTLPRQTTGKAEVRSRDSVALIVMTGDPLVSDHLLESAHHEKATTAGDLYRVAQNKFQRTQAVLRRLQELGVQVQEPIPSYMRECRDLLRRASVLLEQTDFPRAVKFSSQTEHLLQQVQQAQRQQAASVFANRLASPLCLMFETLPLHYQFAQHLKQRTWSTNILPAGGFDSLAHIGESDWQLRTGAASPDTAIDLVDKASTVLQQEKIDPAASHSGLALRLRSSGPAIAGTSSPMLEIESPAIAVPAGQVYRIEGWVRIGQQIDPTGAGLVIYDSISGPSLALRLTEPVPWQPFTFYRVATRPGSLSVTLSLQGRGEVWIDDVRIALLQPRASTRAMLGVPELKSR